MDNGNQPSLEETLERMRALLTDVNPALYPHIEKPTSSWSRPPRASMAILSTKKEGQDES